MSRAALLLGAAVLIAALGACGPSNAERDANERARVELEKRAQREAAIANQAISDMNRKAFRKRTPDEQAKYEAELAEEAHKLIEAQKKAEADAASRKP
ncbi:MAG: hypothetical protein ABIZ04_15760 [Opitutus sp.]